MVTNRNKRLALVLLSLLLLIVLHSNLLAQKAVRLDSEFENFEAINTSTNENSLNKIGREYFLLEVDVHGSKFFSPSIKLSQAVYKTRETMAIEELKVEEFYFLLNHDFIYSGPVVSHNLNDYIFSATKRHNDGGIRSGQKLQLYTAQIKEDAFTNIKRLPFVQRNHNYCHASLRANGNLMIFASDMPGGHGGFDLYAVARVDGNWSRPYNLGPTINSIDDELYPFFSEAGSLFFSSDRFGGVGATDIYESIRIKDGWSSARNIGPPYNSKSHDFGFRLLNINGFGTLSSDRHGGKGKGDVYTFVYSSAIDKDQVIAGTNGSVSSSESTHTTNTIIINNFIGLSKEESIAMAGKDAYVIHYQGRDIYNPAEFNRDKEAYLKTLPVVAAQRIKGADLPNLSAEHNQFVQIKVKGYEDIILTPEEANRPPFNFKFVEKGWKHMPGNVIFSDGHPVSGVKVELIELDGANGITAFTDDEGKFTSRVLTSKNYEVRLYSDGLQVYDTFEFDPEDFDQLVIDMTVSRSRYQQEMDAINDVPEPDLETSAPIEIEEPVVVEENIESAPSIEDEVLEEHSDSEIVESKVSTRKMIESSITRELYKGDETGNFYIIGGSFSAEYRAERRKQLLISNGFLNTKLMKVKGRPYFMVMVERYNELGLALTKEKEVFQTIDSGYILRKEPTELEMVTNH